ncbi:flavin reductase family protein [Pelagerythrobacter rhizovicinus]|uniref:Flavin reductase n=1 Tax=Pelagerythrobacter rhizovicinus TaxID=2268576 RepID=A0A4Q2KJF5_9SPHN|nr:flavin reductase family protein [Pelagerythrobacter rhizovicinus]RXZ65354.1 flavin reductase [Pelagerythrobacter rhizovicinus]
MSELHIRPSAIVDAPPEKRFSLPENRTGPQPLESFLEAMARLASAVHIVTTHHAGSDYGMTVTAVTSLSTDPRSILLSVNRKSAAHDALVAAGELCINTLRPGQAALARTFAGITGVRGHARFEHGAWEFGDRRPPVLRDAASLMLCNVLQSHVIGTHRVFACSVSSVMLGQETQALVYGNRRFGEVAYIED